MRRVTTAVRWTAERRTDLEDAVFQVQDVDVVVSRTGNQTVVLSPQRDRRSHDAGSQLGQEQQTHLGVEDHGVDLRDLQAGSERGSGQRHGSRAGRSRGSRLTCTLVSLSTQA